MWTVLTMTLYCLGVLGDWTDNCPAPCTCKWTSGKKSAFCRQAGFTHLPHTLNSDLQVLDLTGNNILYLGGNAFKALDLVNLQRIFLKEAGVREIHKDAFKDLTILIEVDLSDNSIPTLHQHTFTGNDRLKALYLNGNPLSELVEAQFPVLPHLKTLELQHCRIRHVHRKAFVNLIALESLSLNGNRLTRLAENVFVPLTKLKSLSLDGNPWRCDCRLRGFRNWLLTSNKLYAHSLSCTEPSVLTSERWEDVSAKEFACSPSVSLLESSIRGEPGENVTLRCGVRGDPQPYVVWMLNGNVIGNSSEGGDHALVEELDDPELLTQGEVEQDEEVDLNVHEEEDDDPQRWTSLVIRGLSESDAGEYACLAKNIRGQAVANLSLVLPEVAVATTLSKGDTWPGSWRMWAGVVVGSSLLILLLTLLMIIFSIFRKRPKKRLNKSSSYGEQDKKLLEASITTTTDNRSCEGTESIANEGEVELCDQPLHIRIESRSADLALYRPNPEFPAPLPPAPFGNIYISVSLNPEPLGDNPKYPDLLDHRTRASVASGPDTPLFSTLPRRTRTKELDGVRAGLEWDNMGPRVTAAGSSTLSLPDASPDDIPPPPPPPNCLPLTVEYVSL